MVQKTLDLIAELNPTWWVMENPRAMLRKMPMVEGLDRLTVTYCQYGEFYMKPTDLWGHFPPMFQARACAGRYEQTSCHERAPRGSRTGVQGLKGAAARGKVQAKLAFEICIAAEMAQST